MPKLERRAEPLRLAVVLAPLAAVVATAIVGAALFALLGKDPARALALFFVEPLASPQALSELSIKATPLVLIGLGLAVCLRANVWNIGAEGQFILGAIAAGGVAIQVTPETNPAVVIVLLLAGALGGAAYAGVVAVLRDRFNANEILVSLMLVYVAEMLLLYLVHGPWRDPNGYNFPQTVTFPSPTQIPRLVTGYRANFGVALALVLVPLVWLFLFRFFAGFKLRVVGAAALAARFAGFSSRRALYASLLLSGAFAGLAGALEVAGPVGQLTAQVPVGYGFAAIIVALIGRLHPVGIVASGILMSMFTIGGELAQSRLGLPKALTGVFQGICLFALLTADALSRYRLRLTPLAPAQVAPRGAGPEPVPTRAGPEL
jgi:simple sugar transport system permease protein